MVSPDYETVIETADGTARLVVPKGAAPELLEIRFEKMDLASLDGAPPGDAAQVVLAIDVNTFKVGEDTPTPTTYLEGVELWLQLPEGEESACEEERVSVYRVEPDQWAMVEHRCETDDSGQAWAVSVLTYFSTYTLVIEPVPEMPAPAPTPTATPTAEPTAAPTPPAEVGVTTSSWLAIALAASALLLVVLVWLVLLLRRRRPRDRSEGD